MQQLDGRPLAEILGDKHATCDIQLPLPTFTQAAEMAGISRIMGGYHIQADNLVGLELGRDVAQYSWPKYQAYFNGTAKIEHGKHLANCPSEVSSRTNEGIEIGKTERDLNRRRLAGRLETAR